MAVAPDPKCSPANKSISRITNAAATGAKTPRGLYTKGKTKHILTTISSPLIESQTPEELLLWLALFTQLSVKISSSLRLMYVQLNRFVIPKKNIHFNLLFIHSLY